MSEIRYGGPSPYSDEARARRKRIAEQERRANVLWWIRFVLIVLAIFGIGYLGGVVAKG